MRASLVLMAVLLTAGCGGATEPPGGPPPSTPPAPPPPPPPPPSPVATTLVVHLGDSQEAVPGTAVPVPPAVRVLDAGGQPFPAAPVTFVVDTGGGSVTGATILTGADGVARVERWILGRTEGRNRLRVSSGALPAVTISATARFPRGTNPTVDRTVTVALPAGSPLVVTALEAAGTLGHVPLAPDGTFTLPFFASGPQLAMVLAAGGEPVLMGWIDGGDGIINVRTTAEVLAFFDLGGFRVPSAAARAEVHRQIAGWSSQLVALEQAIAAALQSTGVASLITPAVDAARAALRTTVMVAANTPPIHPGSRIEPTGLQSGLAVDEIGYQKLRVANWYRRRVAVFLDRLAYVPAAGGPEVAEVIRGSEIRLGAANGLQTVAGGFVDIVTGNEAWEPAESRPIPTPLAPPDARVTRYRLIVVGPGGHQNTTFSILTPDQRKALESVSFESVMLEMVLPLLSTAVSGLQEADKYFGDPEILKALSNFQDHFPAEAIEKAVNGDLPGATQAVLKLMVQSEDVQRTFGQLVEKVSAKYLGGIYHPAMSFHVRDRALRLLSRLDVVFGLSDVLLATVQLGSAEKVTAWDILINRSRVKIKEGSVKLNLGDLQPFHAVVLDADGAPGPAFEYRWTTTGTVGQINQPGGPTGTTVPLPGSDVVSYTAGFTNYGTDQVILDAFIRVDGRLEPIGSDTVSVEVVRGQVLLTPRLASLLTGQQETFTVRVEDARLIGGVLSYRWSTTGRYGTLEGLRNGFENNSPSTIYTARSGVEGSDVIAVEVISTEREIRTSLGRTTATVKVEKRKSVFAGTWAFETVSYQAGNNARVCLKAVASFPLVEGATQYTVTQYGGGAGSGLSRVIQPTATTYRPCDGTSYGRNGIDGNAYRYMMAGFNGPAESLGNALAIYQSRFGGLLIEVKVEY